LSYDQELGRLEQLLDANDVTFVPGLNEEAAATAVQAASSPAPWPGAARDGVIGIWYGKAPGLDRATRRAAAREPDGSHPKGGALVLVGDDPAAKSSTLPCASDSALADLNIPYLYPADSQDVLDLGRHAIELLAGHRAVDRAEDRHRGRGRTVNGRPGRDVADPRIPAGAGTHTPTARLLHPRWGQLERDLVTNRLRLAREYARLNGLNRLAGAARATSSAWSPPGTPSSTCWPLAPARHRGGRPGGQPGPLAARRHAVAARGGHRPRVRRRLEEILVVEEKRSFLETAIRDVLYGSLAQLTRHRQARRRRLELIPGWRAGRRPDHGPAAAPDDRRRGRGGGRSSGRRRPHDPAAGEPGAVLLLGLPAQQLDQAVARDPGRRRHRLPRPGAADG
jgi:indolepyruvate ferredoxin oxidoreductase